MRVQHFNKKSIILAREAGKLKSPGRLIVFGAAVVALCARLPVWKLGEKQTCSASFQPQ